MTTTDPRPWPGAELRRRILAGETDIASLDIVAELLQNLHVPESLASSKKVRHRGPLPEATQF